MENETIQRIGGGGVDESGARAAAIIYCTHRRNNSSSPPRPTSVRAGISTSHGARSRPVVAAAAVAAPAAVGDGNYTYMAIYTYIRI